MSSSVSFQNRIDYEFFVRRSKSNVTETDSRPTNMFTIKILSFDIFRSCVVHPDDGQSFIRLPEEERLVHQGELHLDDNILLSSDLAKQILPEILSRNLTNVHEACHAKIIDSLCSVARSIASQLDVDVDVDADGSPTNNKSMILGIAAVITKVYDFQEFLDIITPPQQPNLIPATQSAIDALQRLVFNGDNDSGSMQECVICMEEFQAGLEVTCLPCKHIFHGDCIVHWLHTSHSCPICRCALPRVDEQ